MNRTERLTGATTASVLALALVALGGPEADARPAPPVRPQTLATGLLAPLSAAAAPDGTRYFSSNFSGVLYEQKPGRKPTRLFASARHDEVGAVSERHGVVTFAVTGHGSARLEELTRKVGVRAVADLGAYERHMNPDHVLTYGFEQIGASCAKSLPNDMPAKYHGLVDSHPYASLMTADTTYVADAGGNDILGVGRNGRIRTVAVLPPVPTLITKAGAKANHLPACLVGKTYDFEAVPTDVELGPDGNLYVSTLPGGPEDGSFGAHAQVLRVNPRTGRVSVVAKGLISAVGLAVTKSGDIFVSELFAGRIVKLKAGSHTAHTFLKVAFPGDVEVTDQGLLYTDNVLSGLSGQAGDKPAGELTLLPY